MLVERQHLARSPEIAKNLSFAEWRNDLRGTRKDMVSLVRGKQSSFSPTVGSVVDVRFRNLLLLCTGDTAISRHRRRADATTA